MKTIVLAALIALTPAITLASEGFEGGECDNPATADPHRCGSAAFGNPFYVPPGGGRAFTGAVQNDGVVVQRRPVRRR
jgi:hypothetical protein